MKRRLVRILIPILLLIMVGINPRNMVAQAQTVIVKGTATCALRLNQSCGTVTLASPGYFRTISLGQGGQGVYNWQFTGVPANQSGQFTFDVDTLKCPVYTVDTTPPFLNPTTVDVGPRLCVPSSYPTTSLKIDATLRDPLNGRSINTNPTHHQRPLLAIGLG